jgi:hypothetical protein
MFLDLYRSALINDRQPEYLVFDDFVWVMGLAEKTPVKHLLAVLFALVIVAVGVAGLLMDRAGTPPAPVRPDKPPEPEHFAGSAETLSPAELRAARERNRLEMAVYHQELKEEALELERRLDIARARPHSIRLPKDLKWGRCLLVVEGKTQISGRCAYSQEKNGALNVEGPRQIYEGIDYPKTTMYAEVQSNDYWADVVKEDGVWTGYGNNSREGTHAAGPWFGPLRRRGNCFIGKHARICVWKERMKAAAAKSRRLRAPVAAIRTNEAE